MIALPGIAYDLLDRLYLLGTTQAAAAINGIEGDVAVNFTRQDRARSRHRSVRKGMKDQRNTR